MYAPTLFVSGAKFYIKDDLSLVEGREHATWYKDREEVKLCISEYRNTIGADRDGKLSTDSLNRTRGLTNREVTNRSFLTLLVMSIRNLFK